MSGHVESRLAAQGITIPQAPRAAGNYTPFLLAGGLVHISGQTARGEGGTIVHAGKLGRDIDLAEGQRAARLCAINILSQLKAACDGDLDRVARCIRLGGFVCSDDAFFHHPDVLNGASEVIIAAFGEAGRHVRVAVGVAALPSNSAVEVEATFELRA